MKKSIKIAILCIAVLLSMIVGTTRIFAANSTTDINSIFTEEIEEVDSTDNSDNQSTDNSETSNTQSEQQTAPAQNTSAETTSTTQTTPAQNTSAETTSTTQTTQAQNTSDKKTVAAESIEEEKIPQTGEAENYMLIIVAVVFSGIAIYAYKKNKKISL